MITLLVIAVLFNYVDRGNLALAAPLLSKEWGMSASQLGILLSAFFWTDVLLQVPMGWLVDRFSAASLLAFGFLAWSGATIFTGLARGFAALLAMRLLLGVGEAVIFPASSKIFSENLEEKDRGLANGLLVAAIRWGTAVGAFGGGLLMAHFGWRRTFLAIGLLGLLWLPAWQRWKPERVIHDPQLPAYEPPSFASILRLRPFWGASIGHLGENYLLYLLMSWLPFYLVHERHLSATAMAWTAGVIYAIDSLASIVTGRIADLRIRRGASACAARKWPMVAGYCHCCGLAAGLRDGRAQDLAAVPHRRGDWVWKLLLGRVCGAADPRRTAAGRTLGGPAELRGELRGDCGASADRFPGPADRALRRGADGGGRICRVGSAGMGLRRALVG